MFTGVEVGMSRRKPSVSMKKKVLFLTMGPPKEAAHWLALSKGRAVPVLLLNQSFALSMLPFQKYSALPWNLLVPDLVTKLTFAPANWPYSPVYPLFTTEAVWTSFVPSNRLVAPELLRFR